MVNKLYIFLFGIGLTLLMSACGGGGGGTPAPPATYSTVKVKLKTNNTFTSYTSGFASLQATLTYPQSGTMSITTNDIIASGTMANLSSLLSGLTNSGEVTVAAIPVIDSSVPQGYLPYKSFGEFVTLTFTLSPATSCPASSTFILKPAPDTDLYDIDVNSISQLSISILSVTCP